MNLLFIADIVGKPGREAAEAELRAARQDGTADFVIANCENAAGGFGVTPELARGLLDLGVDVLTSGNHIWDKREAYEYLEREQRLLRPANYPPGNPGRGSTVACAGGLRIAVINLQGRVFMAATDCPFRAADRLIRDLSGEADLIFVDFHAEATAEKVAFGWYVDGRVTAVVGTHTHVQTADARILPEGTAYLTDAGMTGAVDGVIGVRKELAIDRFLKQTPNRFEVATENVRCMGVRLEVDDASGRVTHIVPFDHPLKA
ncbi:MAG: TIGR00282 family metallophosphoesterase, partial [Gemmatimonadetes bacterium]|nr:TIGR00282 family metallophosphoesterase [Gemmatimonadota bacterium]